MATTIRNPRAVSAMREPLFLLSGCCFFGFPGERIDSHLPETVFGLIPDPVGNEGVRKQGASVAHILQAFQDGGIGSKAENAEGNDQDTVPRAALLLDVTPDSFFGLGTFSLPILAKRLHLDVAEGSGPANLGG